MDEWVIYYNPKCGTCRTTLEILNAKGIEPRQVLYLKNPPGLKELDKLVHKLRVPTKDIVRTKEPVYLKLKMDQGTWSREDILRAISENPVLLQRPIVVRGHRAVIARPPENVNVLFDQ
jgi:arsenate reductase (glutaredoxin)